MRILIIDDDEDLCTLLSHYIVQQWPSATVDIYDPLEKPMPGASFALGSYDVMILDYMLGRGDGLEWLTHFKKRTDCPKILFLTGAQLALGSCDFSKDKGERFVTLVTGALAIWNVGIAFVVGMTAYMLVKRGLLRL